MRVARSRSGASGRANGALANSGWRMLTFRCREYGAPRLPKLEKMIQNSHLQQDKVVFLYEKMKRNDYFLRFIFVRLVNCIDNPI